jgi:plasmid maintenance system antidote protein VapI
MPKNLMRPIHPGEILREEYLLPMGLSAMPWQRNSR